ncbi:hypothetical protein Tco_1409274 [Tanacetum coccineum]
MDGDLRDLHVSAPYLFIEFNERQETNPRMIAQFPEEFCLVTGLKFEVEYWADYNDEDEPIPFRQWVFSSSLNGKPIKGNTVLQVIKSKTFDQLHDDDVVSLCYVGILQLVLLGIEDRHAVPDWILRFMEGMTVGSAPQAKPNPIIVSQHYGLSDFSGFQSMQGGPSTFQTPTNSSFYEVGQAGPSYGYNVATPTNWQTPYWQNPLPSHPGTSNWQSQMSSQSTNPNWQPPIQAHQHDDVLFNPNIMTQPRREHHPSIYRQSPYMDFPPTTVLPKKPGGKSKNKGKKANVSPFNLGNAFNDEDVEGDDVMITSEEDTVRHLCMAGSHTLEPTYLDGWLSGDHMDAWIQLLIRERPKNANWTLSKSGTVCVHRENNRFMIEMNPHIMGTLDGTTRPYPAWKDVNWVCMPINAGGNH